jgi:branched-chain amino acid transport system permease protein
MVDLAATALVTGLAVGVVYALVASGMLIAYSVSSAVNLAHGDIITVGSYVTLAIVVGLGAPFWVALLAAPCLGFALGGVAQFLGHRPFVKTLAGGDEHQVLLTIFIATLSLSLMAEGALALVLPTEGIGIPGFLPLDVIAVGPFRAAPIQVVTMVLGGLACLITALLVRGTQFGRAMKAIAEHPVTAALMGIDTGRIARLGWGLSGVLAALCGTLVAPGSIVTPFSGSQFLFIAFAAAVLGGFGSIEGAIIGGISLGLAQAFFAAFVSTGWSSIIPFAALVVTLSLRPRGIFGRAPRIV